jgi:hypothetical protein
MLSIQLRPKVCAHCGQDFQPWSSTQRVCPTARCAKGWLAAQKKRERAETKTKREAMKTIPQLIKEAQVAFNAFIRARDAGKPCICCGQPLPTGSGSTGGDFDCGHYRSVGSASHLRFDERNAHGQRKVCNRYGAGRAVDYRIGLIARIGSSAVDALEADSTPHKWTRDELIAIRATYKAKLKQLEKNEECT